MMTTAVQFSDCTLSITPTGERMFVYTLQGDESPRAALNAYAQARGIEQYPDGSFETLGVSVCSDIVSGKYETDFTGDEIGVKSVFLDFMGHSGIDGFPIPSAAEIYVVGLGVRI